MTIYSLDILLSQLEQLCCSMSSSNCCFLTCMQISQEASKVICFFCLLRNFPQFAVVHTIKGFGIIKKTEVDVFLKLSCLFNDTVDADNLIAGSFAFSKSSLNIWKFIFQVLLKPRFSISIYIHPFDDNWIKSFFKTGE